MKQVPPDVRRLALRAGLGDLNCGESHHGYANGCSCTNCMDRADRYNALIANGLSADRAATLAELDSRPEPKRARQPWDARTAA